LAYARKIACHTLRPQHALSCTLQGDTDGLAGPGKLIALCWNFCGNSGVCIRRINVSSISSCQVPTFWKPRVSPVLAVDFFRDARVPAGLRSARPSSLDRPFLVIDNPREKDTRGTLHPPVTQEMYESPSGRGFDDKSSN
jgi:hypothetical protein